MTASVEGSAKAVSGRLKWMQWTPGVGHGERRLGEVLATLPAAAPEDIPAVIRFFENPASRWASPGAIVLGRHDALHVLLGRGLKPEDEAFVVGFTNGCAGACENRQTAVLRAVACLRHPLASRKRHDRAIGDMQFRLFLFAATRLYPRNYRFTPGDALAYRLGFGLGERNSVRDVHDFPFENAHDRTVDELRASLGIHVSDLESAFAQERLLLNTPESRRLEVNWYDDDSDVEVPDGPDSDWVREKVAAVPRARRAAFGGFHLKR